MNPNEIYIGVMSGTSLDGADAVALHVCPANYGAPDTNAEPTFTVIGAYSVPYSDDIRAACLRLQSVSANELHEAQLLSLQLADIYSAAVNGLLEQLHLSPADIAAVGVHGQTIRHRPELGFSLQLNQPARIAEQTGLTVVSDFRARDIAAGGQGAPLVPAFHDALWRESGKNRVVLNIGGFANISVLTDGAPTFGFDTGPGNLLMDGWIARHQNVNYDAGGAWAAKGTAHQDLLADLLADPYFRAPSPKSTGRDHFHLAWLESKLAQYPFITPVDVQATLLALTAVSIANAIDDAASLCDEVIVAGGGAFNAALLEQLRQHLPCVVRTSADDAIDPIHLEGAAFAWLAYRALHGLTGNLPHATGAHGTRILGSVTLR